MDHEDELRAFLNGSGRSRSQRVAIWVLLVLVAVTALGLAARGLAG